jgi:precorrin-2 dehydrogenase/sirohydrochlorin ferrochelatase
MTMRYYPIFLDIKGRNCLVVGGGGVGTRKVETLLECGALVTVVAIEITGTLKQLSQKGRVSLKKRAYKPSDLNDMFLIIGATNDEQLNRQLSRDAEKNNLLCNIADRPAACNFILPSIVRQGDLFLAISTSGKSPALAKKLRKDLETQFDGAYAVLLDLMGAIRYRLLKEEHAPEQHKPIFNDIIHSNILQMIRTQDVEGIDKALLKILGPGFTFRALMEQARGLKLPGQDSR